MKMPTYIDYIPKKKVKTLALFKTVMANGDSKYKIRPSKRTYEDIISKNDVVVFEPICYDFCDSDEYKGITEAQILCLAAIEGIQIDIEIVDSHDGTYMMMKDLRTGKVLYDREKRMIEKAKRVQ